MNIDGSFTKSKKVSSELFSLTYGALVSQLIKNYNKYAEILEIEDINYGKSKKQFPILKFLKNKSLQKTKIQKSNINLIKDFLCVVFIVFNSLIIFINVK